MLDHLNVSEQEEDECDHELEQLLQAMAANIRQNADNALQTEKSPSKPPRILRLADRLWQGHESDHKENSGYRRDRPTTPYSLAECLDEEFERL